MEELWSKISGLITADNVALLSVIITVLIFVISRRAEIRYKKHDDKKDAVGRSASGGGH